jgi:hypothetical protein
MRALKSVISHDGRTLTQLERSATVAIYELIGSQGTTYGYEVIRIKVKPEQAVFGKLQPEREVYPSDSDFGRLAWSYGSQHRRQAFERYDAIVQAEHQNLHAHGPSAFQRALRKEQLLCN